jgi:hypothetical protein
MKIITFGRHESNEVVINDSKVSRNHLQIIQDDNNNFMLVDFNSTNGTFVNEQRISGEVRLQPNDTIRIGNTNLNWQKYFMQPTFAPVQQPPAQRQPLKITKKIKLWHIAAAIAAVLLIGGGTTIFLVQKAKQKKIELTQAQQVAEEKAKQEVAEQEQQLQAAREAEDKLREEAAALARKALISKSKEDEEELRKLNADLKLAENDTKKKENALTEANNRLNTLQKENETLKKEVDKLNEEKKKAEDNTNKTVEELKKEKAAKEAEIKAKENAQAELEAYKKERLNKLYKDFDALFDTNEFAKIEPKKSVAGKDKSKWETDFGRKDAQKDVLANKTGVKSFEQKQAVYDQLKTALDKKQSDYDNKITITKQPEVEDSTAVAQ